VAKKWKQVTGQPIVEGYGLSETSPVVCANRLDIEEFTGTIGYPLPSTDVSVRAGDGTALPAGERGELCVKGPQVMAGYWQRPDETAKVMTSDGWFRTGDVAVILPDGQVKIVDRMKDMVLVSGFNVYPNEVEDVIVKHPGVMEAAVIGLPDEHSGEAVVAYVVRRDQALTVEELRQFCRENLTGYKVPRRIEFRETLPKTNVGKVLRRALKEEVEQSHAH
jgi:long-chain acyl-CoA synthetase